MVILIVFSFNKEPFPSSWKGATLDWYKELFKNQELLDSFYTSLTIALSTSILCLIFSLLYLYSTANNKMSISPRLFYLNIMIPDTLVAVSLLSLFFLIKVPLGIITIIIAHSTIGLGFSIPIIHNRYYGIDPNLLEASKTLGASAFQTFIRVTIPILSPTLISSFLLIFIVSFDDYILSFFCSGTHIQPLSLYLISSLRIGISPVVNALSTLLLIFTIITLLVFSKHRQTRGFQL